MPKIKTKIAKILTLLLCATGAFFSLQPQSNLLQSDLSGLNEIFADLPTLDDLLADYENIELPSDPEEEFYRRISIEKILGPNAPDFSESTSEEEDLAIIQKFEEEQALQTEAVRSSSTGAIYDGSGNVAYYKGSSSQTGPTTPLPNQDKAQFNALDFDGSTYFAVGQNGALGISTNAADWSTKLVQGNDRMNHTAVTHGDGVVISTGRAGQMFISSDKFNTWKYVASGASAPMFGIAFGKGIFVAAGGYNGDNAVVSSSNKGQSWIVRNPGFEPKGVLFDGSRFIIYGYQGRVSTSADGQSWSPQVSSVISGDWGYVQSIYDMVKIGSEYYAAGGLKNNDAGEKIVLKSQDLKKWEPVTIKGTYGYLLTINHNGNGTIVAAGKSAIFTSTDGGSTWTKTQDFEKERYAIFDLIYDGKKFIGVNPLLKSLIYTSADGSNWQTSPAPGWDSSGEGPAKEDSPPGPSEPTF